MTSHNIIITLSPETLRALKAKDFALYGFKAVGAASSGAPLVWFATSQYLNYTQVTWNDAYEAYVSPDSIAPGAVIAPIAESAISAGQTVIIQADGTLVVVAGGPSGVISILNPGAQAWTGGLGQGTVSPPSPVCALPLTPFTTNVVAPTQKVLLMFAAGSVEAGTVVYSAASTGLLADLTNLSSQQAVFDINTGWSWDGGDWASIVPQGADLASVLLRA